jgi:four helix bundle protein
MSARLQYAPRMAQFKTLNLGIEFFELVSTLEISGHLKDQLHRAASSIPLNLSEGNAKASAKEKRHFFQTAYASLRECQTIFKLLKIADGEVMVVADKLGASLYKLINSQLKDSPNWR